MYLHRLLFGFRDLNEQWIRAKYERQEFVEEAKERTPYTAGTLGFKGLSANFLSNIKRI